LRTCLDKDRPEALPKREMYAGRRKGVTGDDVVEEDRPVQGSGAVPGDIPDGRVTSPRSSVWASAVEKTGDGNAVWRMELQHPEWGEAQVVCPRDWVRPTPEMVQFCATFGRGAARGGTLLRMGGRRGREAQER